jgi:hypothetical protein
MRSRVNRAALAALSSLQPAHSWRVHVPVRNVMMGATAHKRGEASRHAALGIVAG